MDEIGKPGSTLVHIGERHHRRGGTGKQGKLVDEEANARAGGFPAEVEPRRKVALIDVQLLAEVRNLCGFGFQVLIPLVCDHEIENGNAPLDEIDLVGPAIAKVFFSDLAIEPPREEMMDDSAPGEALGAGVPGALDLAPEVCGSLAPMGP